MGNPYFSIKVLHRRRRKVADNYLHKKVPCLRQMNRFNSLGNVQHFNTHNSNIREKKTKEKTCRSQLFRKRATLRNILNSDSHLP